MTDASFYDTYSATIRTENIRLLFYLLVHNYKSIMSGDIGNAYVNAFTKEKIWSNSGLIFPDHIGKKVIIRKALYGLKSSAHAFY